MVDMSAALRHGIESSPAFALGPENRFDQLTPEDFSPQSQSSHGTYPSLPTPALTLDIPNHQFAQPDPQNHHPHYQEHQQPSQYSQNQQQSQQHQHQQQPQQHHPTRLPGVAIRKRVYRACDVCRRKKVKCDGRNPCSHCVAFVEECHYADTKDRTAYSRRYVESLEQRLAKMERALLLSSEETRTTTPTAPCQLLDPILQMTDGLDRPAGQHEQPPWIAGGSNPDVTNGQLAAECPPPFVARTGMLTMDASRNLHFVGSLSSLAAIVASCQDDPSTTGDGSNELGGVNLTFPSSQFPPGERAVTLPHKAICDTLVQAYFDRVHPAFPVLGRPTFLCAYEGLFRSSAASQTADIVLLAMVSAVLACGARSLPRSATLQQQTGLLVDAQTPASGLLFDGETDLTAISAQHFLQSERLGQSCCNDARIDIVQLLLLQSYHLSAEGYAARAWVQVGHAVRLAIDLGLHSSLQHFSMSRDDVELRRRVWWCAYAMDRLLSNHLGRPPAIEDENVDATLPAAFTSSTDVDDSVSGFVAMVSFRRQSAGIVRTISHMQQARARGLLQSHEALVHRLRIHESALEAWQRSLPESLVLAGKSEGGGDPRAIQGCVALACLETARFQLHKALLEGSVGEQRDAELARTVQTALHIIKLAPRVARNVPPGPHLLEYSHSLAAAGVFLATSAARSEQPSSFHLLNEAEECINSLRLVEASLPTASHQRQALTTLVMRSREHLGLDQNEPLVASSSTAPPSVLEDRHVPQSQRKRGRTQPLTTAGTVPASSRDHAVDKRRRRTVSTYPLPPPEDAGQSSSTAQSAAVPSPATSWLDEWTACFGAYELDQDGRGAAPPPPLPNQPTTHGDSAVSAETIPSHAVYQMSTAGTPLHQPGGSSYQPTSYALQLGPSEAIESPEGRGRPGAGAGAGAGASCSSGFSAMQFALDFLDSVNSGTSREQEAANRHNQQNGSERGGSGSFVPRATPWDASGGKS